MVDVIKDYDTDELIDYLRKKDLKLIEADFEIFRRADNWEEFRSYGFQAGPAKRLAKFISDIKEQKLRSFSSYKTLEELKNVLLFEEIDDGDKAFEKCMNEITLRLSNLETMQANANEATRCEVLGRVDYAIKGNEDLICIAKGKLRNVEIGYLQNIMQFESAYHTNKKKRTAEQAFRNDDYDYLYGIVSTGP
ncbi:hypothetical protein Glove_113g46 [Diversispora epigaea]|uniref:SAM domain-containing protein n=1 Tax=Diversispora epigaea TaxID=1348612 RepID=A0A397J1K7_9GLOM|nr:hypothetical protein Glove_113g46 [Diversispora epigaea]